MAVNSWLYSQTQQSPYRYEKDRGYVCTLSALVLKSTTAHLFHAGDARIYRLRDGNFEQLTHDHRIHVSSEQSYLVPRARHPGASRHRLSIPAPGAGRRVRVRDRWRPRIRERTRHDQCRQGPRRRPRRGRARSSRARRSIAAAPTISRRSIVRVDALPEQSANEIHRQLTELPFPPALVARMQFDGFTILRELHSSSRSHVYLASYEDIARAGGHQDAVHGAAGRRRAPGAIPHGRLGGAAHQQCARDEGRGARAPAQLSIHGHRIHRRPDAEPVAHRQSEARGRNRARHHRADRERPDSRSTGSRCSTRTCVRRT